MPALLLFLLLSSAAASAGEFPTDAIRVYWTISQSDQASLTIRKSSKGTRIDFRDHTWCLYVPRQLSLTAEEVVQLGKVFARTKEFAQRFAGTRDQHVTIPVFDKTSVRFQTDGFGAFHVLVVDPQGIDSLKLTKDQAEHFGPHLDRMVEMVKFLDSKVSL